MIEKPVHQFFGLSYAAYSVLPRSILQSMPLEWQKRFVQLMEEMDAAVYNAGLECPDYRVQALNENGKFTSDPFRDYQRGRRNIFKEIK